MAKKNTIKHRDPVFNHRDPVFKSVKTIKYTNTSKETIRFHTDGEDYVIVVGETIKLPANEYTKTLEAKKILTKKK